MPGGSPAGTAPPRRGRDGDTNWEDGESPLDFILAVEDRLIEVVDSRPGIGEVDGNEVGSGTAMIYLYGPDCEHLWRVLSSPQSEGSNPPQG